MSSRKRSKSQSISRTRRRILDAIDEDSDGSEEADLYTPPNHLEEGEVEEEELEIDSSHDDDITPKEEDYFLGTQPCDSGFASGGTASQSPQKKRCAGNDIGDSLGKIGTVNGDSSETKRSSHKQIVHNLNILSETAAAIDVMNTEDSMELSSSDEVLGGEKEISKNGKKRKMSLLKKKKQKDKSRIAEIMQLETALNDTQQAVVEFYEGAALENNQAKRAAPQCSITDNKRDLHEITAVSDPANHIHPITSIKPPASSSNTAMVGNMKDSSHDKNLTNGKPDQTPVRRKKKRAAPQCSKANPEETPPPSSLTNSAETCPQGTLKESAQKYQSGSNTVTPCPKIIKPTPKSTPKRKKETFQDQVLRHMLISVKPFNVRTLAQATKTTEAPLHHLMLSLLDKKLVFKREFESKNGRKKILYWANQESSIKDKLFPRISTEEIDAAKEDHRRFKNQYKTVSSQLSALLQQPTNEQITTHLSTFQDDITQLEQNLKETNHRVELEKQNPSGRNPKTLKKAINLMRSEWRDRREKCMDFVDHLSDALEKKKKDVLNILEVETDEMVGVKIPVKYVIDP